MTKENKKLSVKKYCFPIVLLILGLLYNLPRFFMDGIPEYGHDTLFHVIRLTGLKNVWISPVDYTVVKSGTLVNIFYPWFTMYPMWILYKITSDFVIAFNLYNSLLTVATLLIAFYSMKEMTGDELSSFCFSVVYSFSLYRFLDMYLRTSLGENIAMVFLPLVLLGMYKILFVDHRKWFCLTAGMTLIAYSHILSLYLVSIVVLLITLCSLFFVDEKKKRIVSLIKAAMVSGLFSAGALIPIIRYSITDDLFRPDGSAEMFLANTCSLFSYIINSFFNNLTPFGIGLVVFVLILFNVFFLFRKHGREFLFPCILSVLSIVYMLFTTNLFPWEHLAGIPFVSVIQFPWRLDAFVTLFAAGAFSVFVSKTEKSKVKTCLCIIVSVVTLILFAFMVHGFNRQYVPNYLFNDDFIENNLEASSKDYIPSELYASYVSSGNMGIETYYHDVQVLPVNDRSEGREQHFVIEDAVQGEYIELPVAWFSSLSVKQNGIGTKSFITERGTASIRLDSNGKTDIVVSNSYSPLVYASWILSLLSVAAAFLYYKFEKRFGYADKIISVLRNKLWNKNTLIYVLSFIIPAVISFLVFFSQNIYPGGVNTPFVYDMRAQILPFYGYLSNPGPGFDSLLHSMSGGLGGSFLGIVAYYISPLDLVYSFVSVSSLPDAILLMTVLRIGLCGLFFSVFLNRSFFYKSSSLYIILFSCCYALMSYNIVYSMVPMWFGCVELLPLLALSLERIIRGKKNPWFVVFLVLSIVSNYYIAYMSIIAITIYFVFCLISENTALKDAVRRFAMFAVHGIIGAGISMAVLLPAALDLSRGRLAEGSVSTSNLLIKNGLVSVLGGFAPMSYFTLSANEPPYIFCGSAILIFALVWFLRKDTAVRVKIAGAAVLLIYLCSFIFGPLDRAWHGFHDSLGFSCRYSYTFVFFLICFAFKGTSGLSLEKYKVSHSIRSMLLVLLTVYTVFELYLNGSFLIAKLNVDYVYSTYDEYNRFADVLESGVDLMGHDEFGYHRMAKNFNYSSYDGALFGYDGLQQFSSSYNSRVVDYLGALGLDARNNVINDTGLTPAVANLLDVGYYYSYWYDKSDYYEYIDSYKIYHLYRNRNVLPFCYLLNPNRGAEQPFVRDDPFENINAVYSDIYGSDASVFTPHDFKAFDVETEEGLSMKQLDITPSSSGHYWFYRPYSYNYAGVAGYMPSELKNLGYYADDELLGTYGLNHNRYAADLGYLEAGQTYSFMLDNTYNADDLIYVYRYDDELCSEICASAGGFDITRADRTGLTLKGDVQTSCDAVLSLPYEDGYRIYVNGEKREYGAYRDSLILLRLNPGDDEIVIGYIPKGLMPGIIISLVFIISSVIYFAIGKKKTEKN